MKYERCATCPVLDSGECNGPNLSVLESEEKVDWMLCRMKHLGLTHQALADKANIPKGTIDPILSKRRLSFNNETLRLMLFALGMQSAGENPCPNTETIDAIEQEKKLLQVRLSEAEDKLNQRSYVAESDQRAIVFLKEELQNKEQRILGLEASVRRKEKLIVKLFAALAAIMIAIIAILIYDKTHPDVGWFRDVTQYFSGTANAI